jgi:phosphatidylglycerophosphate synthase
LTNFFQYRYVKNMLDKITRPIKDFLLEPSAKFIGGFLSPNAISTISFLSGLISCVFLYTGQLFPALIFWIANRILDGLDGTVARVSGRQTDFGGYLDIMYDFMLYAVLPLSFLLSPGLTAEYGYTLFHWQILTITLAVFYVNGASWMYLSALLEKRAKESSEEQTSIRMPRGLIGGTETIFFYTLLYLLPSFFSEILTIMSILTFIGTIQRVAFAGRNL